MAAPSRHNTRHTLTTDGHLEWVAGVAVTFCSAAPALALAAAAAGGGVFLAVGLFEGGMAEKMKRRKIKKSLRTNKDSKNSKVAKA